MPFDEILFNLSYANMVLYGAVIPPFDSKKKEKRDTLNSKDPRNKEQILKFFNDIH